MVGGTSSAVPVSRGLAVAQNVLVLRMPFLGLKVGIHEVRRVVV